MATPRLVRYTLRGADGGPLRVDVRSGARPGEHRPAVVICHGFKGFKDWGFFPILAERLAKAGLAAVSFNFSGSGVSGLASSGPEFDELERWRRQKPSADLEDLATVSAFALEQLRAPWLALVGHSRGGALAILQAAREPRVRSLVTWAAIDHFLRFSDAEIEAWDRTGTLEVINTRTGQVLPLGRDALNDVRRNQTDLLNVAAAAARISVAWLIVHGMKDRTVAPETAHRLYSHAAGAETELLLLEEADHTFGIRHPWAGSTVEFDLVMERTIGWISAASTR